MIQELPLPGIILAPGVAFTRHRGAAGNGIGTRGGRCQEQSQAAKGRRVGGSKEQFQHLVAIIQSLTRHIEQVGECVVAWHYDR